MSDPNYENSPVRELTAPAIILGVLMSMILGAANAYLGLKAGMTVAAAFPAAVISMAVLRIFKGTILEENLARTTGAVGEALAAGAIFTIPAFLISGVWTSFNYFQATALLLVGGVLGVLFVILLRRTFMEDKTLPFPESQACTEIVRAGQSGASGAGMVFGAMGLSAIIEFLRNSNGVPFFGSSAQAIGKVGKSIFPIQTPASSPAFLGVGFIIGPRLGAITLSGGVFGWLFLMPIILYIQSSSGPSPVVSELQKAVAAGNTSGAFDILAIMYKNNVKTIAIGAMIVGAFFTLFKMRNNLIAGMKRSLASLRGGASNEKVESFNEDLNFQKVLIAIGATLVAMFGVYFWLTGSILIALVTTIVMAIAGFLFAAVAGFLVSIIGSSSNPISGLTLSTLLLAAGLLAMLGMTGTKGVAAVLGVATVVCCVAGVAGDMIQDWKVGYNLGASPWKMQIGGLIGVTAAALVLVPVLWLLHTYGGGFGKGLPAPQAYLMADMAKGIIGGSANWGLIVIGMVFAFALILIGAPSPMLIAVGMYLPFETVSAIFIGGIIKWIVGILVARKVPAEDRETSEAVENHGLLIASGLVAGEALIGIILAVLVALKLKLFAMPAEITSLKAKGNTVLAEVPSYFGHWATGLLLICGIAAFIIYFTMKKLKER